MVLGPIGRSPFISLSLLWWCEMVIITAFAYRLQISSHFFSSFIMGPFFLDWHHFFLFFWHYSFRIRKKQKLYLPSTQNIKNNLTLWLLMLWFSKTQSILEKKGNIPFRHDIYFFFFPFWRGDWVFRMWKRDANGQVSSHLDIHLLLLLDLQLKERTKQKCSSPLNNNRYE